MSLTADHIGFVLSAYGISAAVILLLIVTHIARARRNDRRLSELEAHDILRQHKTGDTEH
jgi:heme exporter protein CcmD